MVLVLVRGKHESTKARTYLVTYLHEMYVIVMSELAEYA